METAAVVLSTPQANADSKMRKAVVPILEKRAKRILEGGWTQSSLAWCGFLEEVDSEIQAMTMGSNNTRAQLPEKIPRC